MRAAAIIKVEITADRVARVADAAVGRRYTSSYLTQSAQSGPAKRTHLGVLDALRHNRSTNTLSPRRPAVHADGDAIAGERAGERHASELRALVVLKIVRGDSICFSNDTPHLP